MKGHRPAASTLAVVYFALGLWAAPAATAKAEELTCRMGRQCFLYLPDEIDPEKTYWLVVGVHVYRGNGKGAGGLAGWVKKGNCIVVGPSFPQGYQLLGKDSDKQLIGIFKALLKKYNLHRRMFIHGFSGGSQFAHRFAMKYPELVIGCSSHSGGTWAGSVNPKAKHIPFAVSCGEADKSRIDGAKRYFAMLRKGGFHFKARTWPGVGHGLSRGARQMLDDCFNLATTGMYPGQRDALEKGLAEIGKLVEGKKYREALDRLANPGGFKPPASTKEKESADKQAKEKVLPGENQYGWRESKAGTAFLAKVRKAFIAERTGKAMAVIEEAGLAEVARIEADKPDDAAEQLKKLQTPFKGAEKTSRAIAALRAKLARESSPGPATTKTGSRAADPEKKAKSRFSLAKSYLMSGKKDKAAEILRSILADFPKTQAAEEARKKLRELGMQAATDRQGPGPGTAEVEDRMRQGQVVPA